MSEPGAKKSQTLSSRDSEDLGSIVGQRLDALQSQRLGSLHSVKAMEPIPDAPQDKSTEVTPFVDRLSMNGAGEAATPDVSVQKSSRRRLAARFTVDWLVWIALLVGTAALELVHPRAIYIPLNDLPRYSFPLKDHDTVPTWTVPLYAILGPYAIMAPLTAIRHRRYGDAALPYKSLGAELSRLATTLLTAEFATGLLTNSVKLMVGRPRPNFAQRCWPDGNILWKPSARGWNAAGVDQVLQGGVPKCTGKLAVYKEGMKSFPSGHTSWSAAGLSFFSWWLRDYLKPLKAGKRGHAWHSVAAYTPMFGAVLVGVSRYTDYMHHWQDIVVGYVLGTVVSWIMYHIRWPRGWNQTLPVVDRGVHG